MSSHNKRYCGRRKALADPRREVKCPVSECEYNGRIDKTKVHLRGLIVWSVKNEGEAAEEDEKSYKMASNKSKKHTSWFKRYWFTKTKYRQYKGILQKKKLREAFQKKSINKVNVLICLEPLPPPPNKEKN